MATMTLSRDVDASPEAAFAVMADIAGAAERVEAITRIELLTDGAVGVGTRWRETRTMFKREATEEMEITAFDAPRSYSVRSDACGCDFTWTVRVEPKGAGATLSMEMRSKARTFMAKLMTPVGWLFSGAMKKCVAKELDDLKAYIEAT